MLEEYRKRIAEDHRLFDGVKNGKIHRAHCLGIYTGELQRKFFYEHILTLEEYQEITSLIDSEYSKLIK